MLCHKFSFRFVFATAQNNKRTKKNRKQNGIYIDSKSFEITNFTFQNQKSRIID